MRIRGETLGVAYLQALEHPVPRRSARTPAARAGSPRPRRAQAIVMSRLRFARAGRFLQHIIHHVETSSLSDLRKVDLTTAGRAVLALEREQARLHETLKHHLPPSIDARRRSCPESQPEQVVHGLLARLDLDYGKPITLKRCARDPGMNAAYMFDLFSHAVGVPFKTYLTELRIEKAKGLIGDPGQNLSRVAGAVGYATEDRFRIAFRKATGLSPKLWRQTMQLASA